MNRNELKNVCVPSIRLPKIYRLEMVTVFKKAAACVVIKPVSQNADCIKLASAALPYVSLRCSLKQHNDSEFDICSTCTLPFTDFLLCCGKLVHYLRLFRLNKIKINMFSKQQIQYFNLQ